MDLFPRTFRDWSNRLPSIIDEDWQSFLPSSGLTVSEDDSKVYIEAAVPGINPDNIDATFENGTLWIRGREDDTQEDRNRKFYRRAARAFSYRVDVPGNIDPNAEPEVTYRDGILSVIFMKLARETETPKKLKVKKA